MFDTEHSFYVGDSRSIDSIDNNEVDLVVTSPPYPMIEMWDEVFSEMNGDIESALEHKKGYEAFEMMHKELDKVWNELDRVTTEDATICINIGDATRKVDNFHLFHNHARIIEKFADMGYGTLPSIIWRKPTNKANKFMGSGMTPPNAYVTLEHEYVLVFRKGGTRQISENKRNTRYESAYFWEERNKWFSDTWTNILGDSQEIDKNTRDRAASYPMEIPHRIINMYSIHQDTVLDPFVGTGTTSLAAAINGRNSIGLDIKEEFVKTSKTRIKESAIQKSKEYKQNRIKQHKEFMKSSDKTANYEAENYSFGVITKQEKHIQIPEISSYSKENESTVRCSHRFTT